MVPPTAAAARLPQMSKFAEDLKSRSVRSLSKIKQRLQRRRAGRVPMPGAPLPRSQSMQPKAADRASTNNGGGGGGLGVGGTPLGGRPGRRQKRSTSVRAVRSGHSANSRLTPVNEPGGASSRYVTQHTLLLSRNCPALVPACGFHV